jgi:hypothetical protein
MIPLLASGATIKDLTGPLSGINALDCSNQDQLFQLITDASRDLSVDASSPSAYRKLLSELVAASSLSDDRSQSGSEQARPEVPESRSNRYEKNNNILLKAFLDAATKDGYAHPGDMVARLSWSGGKFKIYLDQLLANEMLRQPNSNSDHPQLTPKGVNYVLENGLD